MFLRDMTMITVANKDGALLEKIIMVLVICVP